ncbi:MAG TPA: hypothetical protein VKR58_05515 [Aquella sp.]|nr:hypothetical protein [Aquella sp.]
MTNLRHQKALLGVTDHIEVLKNEAKEIGNEIRLKAVDVTKVVREKAVDVNDNVIGLIKKNPYKSVVTAFLAGLVISRLL